MTHRETYNTSKPVFDLDTKLTTWTEYRRSPEGHLIHSRTVTATEWEEYMRTDCFCCSCSDVGASDHACRNHGFYGRRPCERHKLPGEEDEEGNMPHSVEEELSRYTEGAES